MPCGCRGNARRGGWAPSEILGYEYISPAGVSSRTDPGDPGMSLVEARAQQRAHGGGTIKGIRARAAAG
jgi:hypothetical protein